MSESHGSYYVPARSAWPILGAIAVLCIAWGSLHLLHSHYLGPTVLIFGVLALIFMLVGWFGDVIRESRRGLYSEQMDRSFRWGMVWFIFSEIMFFAAFFGALFYAREFSVPWLSGAGENSFKLTHLLLWPDFKAAWPLMHNPDPNFVGPRKVLSVFGIPALNTLILLSSAVALTWAHWALRRGEQAKLLWFLALTIVLGLIFEGFQVYEYFIAHNHYGLKISTGIYGSTFYLLTGFHALHVIVGLLMLIVIFVRTAKRHFTPDNHFAFEAAAWYWHFVDAVWLLLFVFVYWL